MHRALLLSTLIAIGLIAPGSDAEAQRDAPGLVAHEWGVWKIEQGRPTLAELAAESPAFVIRAPGAPAAVPLPPPGIVVPPAPPGIIGPRPPQVARKPVMFLYADRPTDVTVDVGFAGGQPWLYYPVATPTGAGLRWEGTLYPSAQAVLPAAAPGHFWHDLRAVSPALFVTAGGGSAERFLFYDGPVRFERSFLIARRDGGALVTPMSTERSLWLVSNGRFTESEVLRHDGTSRLVTEGDMATLSARLRAELEARGLTTPEARSLLDTWRDELFASPAPRAIYFVPRDSYDRMLPVRITPAPVDLVRVGLVIEEI